MKTIKFLLALPLVMLSLDSFSADSEALAKLQSAADKAEAEARKLSTAMPCEQDNQCSLLLFDDGSRCGYQENVLSEKHYSVYSLLSPTAELARQRTEEQRRRGDEIRKIDFANSEPFLCPASISSVIPPKCVSGRCIVPVDTRTLKRQMGSPQSLDINAEQLGEKVGLMAGIIFQYSLEYSGQGFCMAGRPAEQTQTISRLIKNAIATNRPLDIEEIPSKETSLNFLRDKFPCDSDSSSSPIKK